MKDKKPASTKNNKGTKADKAVSFEVENRLRPLFESIDSRNKGAVTVRQLLDKLEKAGICEDDARLGKGLIKQLNKASSKNAGELKFEEFVKLMEGQSGALIKKAFLNNLSVPDFKAFSKDVEKIFKKTKRIGEGKTYDGKSDGDSYAIAICTVDGQKLHLGNHNEIFPLQSVCKAINYAIALHEVGEKKVHQHVNREPSGRGYKYLELDQNDLPHNPMINAGAIMISSLIKPELPMGKRRKHIKDIWSKLCGGTTVGFNEELLATDIKESERNMALSYHMAEKGAFPKGTEIHEAMELYLNSCAIEMNIDQLATAAATLAHGGICPISAEKVFNSDDIRDCLSLMLSCGMYDYSGEFAFRVGLPAKSGVSGAMMVVIPGLMGIAIYSPKIDEHGNTLRGIAFCKELVKMYSFHMFDHIVDHDRDKKDPRIPRLQDKMEGVVEIGWAASQGDLIEVQNHLARGVTVNARNIDHRTPLHMAAAEGHYKVVKYLLEYGADANAKDRWGRTPLADALFADHTKVASLIRKYEGEE